MGLVGGSAHSVRAEIPEVARRAERRASSSASARRRPAWRPTIDAYARAGIRPLLLATFYGRTPSTHRGAEPRQLGQSVRSRRDVLAGQELSGQHRRDADRVRQRDELQLPVLRQLAVDLHEPRADICAAGARRRQRDPRGKRESRAARAGRQRRQRDGVDDERDEGRPEPRRPGRGLDDPPVRPELGDADRLDDQLGEERRSARPADLDHRVGPLDRQRALPVGQLRLEQVHDVQLGGQHAAHGAVRHAVALRQSPRGVLPLPGARPVRERHAERPRGVLRRAAEQRLREGRLHDGGEGEPGGELELRPRRGRKRSAGDDVTWRMATRAPGECCGGHETSQSPPADLPAARASLALPSARAGRQPHRRTVAATSIGQTAATLRADVNPHGAATTYAFQYGTTHRLRRADGGAQRRQRDGRQARHVPPHRPDARRALPLPRHRLERRRHEHRRRPLVQDEAAAGEAAGGARHRAFRPERERRHVHRAAQPRRARPRPTASSTAPRPRTGWRRSASRSAPASLPQSVSFRINSLASHTTYHFRVVASNRAGTTFGPDTIAQTGPFPPGKTRGLDAAAARRDALAPVVRHERTARARLGRVRRRRLQRRHGLGALHLAPRDGRARPRAPLPRPLLVPPAHARAAALERA